MTRMNWNRCSRLLVVLVLGLVLAGGAAGAVTVSESDAPGEAEVGTEVSATVTLTELYQDPSLAEWTLQGETELTSVTWTITTFDQTGSQIGQRSVDSSTFEREVSTESDVSEIRIRITGDVPEVESWSYDPPQSFVLANLDQVPPGGSATDIETIETHHYTSESQEAREAIESAEAAIEETGANDEARSSLDSAISAYEAANFENAVNIAERAEEEARQSRQQSQQFQLVLYVVGAIVLIAVIVGAVYWYRQNQTASKL